MPVEGEDAHFQLEGPVVAELPLVNRQTRCKHKNGECELNLNDGTLLS